MGLEKIFSSINFHRNGKKYVEEWQSCDAPTHKIHKNERS